MTNTSYTGLLRSKIGYDSKDPMRAVIRGPGRQTVPEGAEFMLLRIDSGETVFRGAPAYWGEIWKSCWWILDFSGIEEPGEYRLAVTGGGGKPLFESEPFRIGPYTLWDATATAVALDQMEERVRRA